YSSRLNKTGRFELLQVREGKRSDESSRLLEASQGYLRVALDERGELADTLTLHKKLSDWEMRGEKGVAFLVGGADGHTDELRQRADWLLSLSNFTLQHELALVVLLEQLYRIETLKRGEPYHR
ncbi:MAG TPA: 23S rRNA (pseudouridine(1915)-N(3))-methyltransferase RlmH, partial [Meiothermus sp.]|nr:23S rRNA (pseudouridine(1915)-N(3))-methyltransferase RlmH [Meiothermus sp.]